MNLKSDLDRKEAPAPILGSHTEVADASVSALLRLPRIGAGGFLPPAFGGFQLIVGNVEVCVDFLDIVVIFQQIY